jgi:TRAP-type mannitol/chloroaromatic compound transport system substrate-binding protein
MSKKVTMIFILLIMLSMSFLTYAMGAEAVEQEDQVVKWDMASTWTSTYLPVEGDKYWAEQVGKMSGGRFQVTHYPAGALMGAFEVFDAVSMGTPECAGEFPGYWVGKNTAFDILASVPCYFTWPDWMLWYFEAGGKELYDEIYGKYNLKHLPLMQVTIEQGLQSNTPIRGLEDLKGLKVRVGTLTLMDLIKDVGGESMQLPGGDTYEAMMRGTIDAFEVGPFSVNYNLGLHEVAKYTIVPAWWQPNTINGMIINKDAWDKLPDDLKAIAENASLASLSVISPFAAMKDAEALKAVKDYGVEIIQFPKEDIEKIQEIVAKSLAENAKKNPDFKKVLVSQMKYLKKFEDMREISEPFGWGMNPFVYPDLAELAE